jgi:hypothetical protein
MMRNKEINECWHYLMVNFNCVYETTTFNGGGFVIRLGLSRSVKLAVLEDRVDDVIEKVIIIVVVLLAYVCDHLSKKNKPNRLEICQICY